MNKRLDAIAALVQGEAPGLSAQAFGVFMVIAREDCMSLKQLSRELGVSQAEVMRAVAELSAWELESQRGAGLVRTREKGPLKKEVVLSEKGQRLKEKIERVVAGKS